MTVGGIEKEFLVCFSKAVRGFSLNRLLNLVSASVGCVNLLFNTSRCWVFSGANPCLTGWLAIGFTTPTRS
jgi:hypothetical protein